MKENITKQLLHVRGSVWDSDSIRAGTARKGNSETRAFDVVPISSVQKHGLFHVPAQLLFRQVTVTLLSRNSTMQRYKGNVGCACSKTSTLETCSDSVWYFISFNADCLQCKVLCYDSQTDPRCAPVLNYTYISVHFVVCGRSLIYTWKVWSALISRNWCYFTMDIDYLGSATMVWFLNIYFLYVDSELNLAISILTRTSISITILSTDCTLLCTLGKYLTLCK